MFTYNANELSTSSLFHVRLLISDNVDAGHFFEDEEIEFAISQETNLYRAAANLCRTVAARLARDVSLDDAVVKFDSRKAADHYLTLAKTYDAKADADEASLTGPADGGLSMPTIGNGSSSLPAFVRELHFS